MLNVRRMVVLREVVRAGSIAKAAKQLNLSPSAVSQQLSQLERELDVALVERRPQRVEVTDAGKKLVEHTETILASLAEAEADVLRVARGGDAAVRLGAFSSAASSLLGTFLQAHGAETEIVLAELDPEAAVEALRLGTLDLAVIWQYDYVPLRGVDTVEFCHLFDDPIDVMLAKGHPLADRDEIGLSELAETPWIASTKPSSCQPFTRRACRAAGFSPRIVAESNDHHTVQQLVATGTGAAFAGRLSLERRHPEIAVVAIAGAPLRRRVELAWRRGRVLPKTVVTVRDALVELAGQRAGPGSTSLRAVS
jgi:molybdate transport repressor ModE-like protein